MVAKAEQSMQPGTDPHSNQLSDKLMASLQATIDSAMALRDALIHRDLENIWEILAEQQEKSEELENYSRLWQQTYGDMEFPPDHEISKQRSKIRSSLIRLQIIERVNATLARSYTSIIEKAFESGMDTANKKRNNGYNRRGRKGSAYSSMLVKQLG